jgi:RNA methyltransferase, TrmH family
MERITARNNDKIKYAVQLSTSSSKRRETGEFFLEGARLCSDAAKTGVQFVRAFFTASALEKYSDYIADITDVCSECYEISNEVAAKLSDTGSSQGVFCVCKSGNSILNSIDFNGKYLALENIQDPSNLGAISRSAEALGLTGLIVSGGCDIYNPKALRAAMGSSLRIKITITENLPELLKKCENSGMLTLASVPNPGAEDIRSIDFTKGTIICIGNEGNGLTAETINTCKKQVTIPMDGRAESFNASAAAAILAWELKR